MGKVVTVLTEEAPKPLGHYSQAVRGGGLIHISGQLPITRSGVPDNQSASFNAQAKLVLQNFLAILDAAGAEKQDVLKVTAYVVGAENWPLFNQAFTEAFGDHRPSRSVVPVPELHHGYLIEIDGVALDAARLARMDTDAWRGRPSAVTIGAASIEGAAARTMCERGRRSDRRLPRWPRSLPGGMAEVALERCSWRAHRRFLVSLDSGRWR